MSSKILIILLIVLGVSLSVFLLKRTQTSKVYATPASIPSSFYSIPIHSLDGQPLDLSQFKGRVVMVVNVASKCGFTKQYEGLENLYKEYKDQGLVILGAPSNDFGGQEPGTAEEIAEFCSLTYGVTFPMTEKVDIKGEDRHPLYQFLTQSSSAHSGNVRWNFTKFLIDKNGTIVDRFSPNTKPKSKKILDAITTQLAVEI